MPGNEYDRFPRAVGTESRSILPVADLAGFLAGYSNYYMVRKFSQYMLRHIIVVALFATTLAACQSGGGKAPEPQKSTAKKIGDAPVEGGLFSAVFKKKQPRAILLPPDLVGDANDKVRENHEQASLLESQKVLPEVTGASVMNTDGRRWLKVETNAEEVWDKLTEFWAAEQIDLVDFQPAAGLMETDWIDTNNLSERDKNRTFAKLFDRIVGQGTSFDKYKIRLERESDNVTRVYVSHRSSERKESQFSSPQKVTQWEWVEGDSDEEKVAQLLQVIVLLFEGAA